MLDSSRLIGWARTHDRRARKAAPAARLTVVFAILAGAGLAAAMAQTGDPRAASELWTAAIVVSAALAFVTTGFRLFWSADADALARHPIAGRPLFRLGTVRNLRVAVGFVIPNAVALAGFAIMGEAPLALGHSFLLVTALSGTVALGPAASLLGGSLAASERAAAISASFGGEFQAPRGAYLGLIPGIAGAGLVLALIIDRAWASGGQQLPSASLVLVLIGPLAWLIADARADRVMPAAVRELSAFNQRRLAHVEVTKLTLLEDLAVKVAPKLIGPLLSKDLRVLRRRHPAYYLCQSGAVVAVWIGALTGSNAYDWTVMTLCALHLYSVVMVWRGFSEPIEIPRLLAFLPLSRRHKRVAKQVPLTLRTAIITVLVGGSLYYQASSIESLAVIVGTSVLATIAGVIVIVRRVH